MTAELPTKSALRSTLRARRAEFVGDLLPEVLDSAFTTLPRRLWPLFAPSAVVGLYHAVGAEAPTTALIHFALDARRPVALPRVEGERMSFRLWSPGDALEDGVVPQPVASAPCAEPELVIAPLVGFDPALRRLGQGGGFYDRWLADHPAARTIGLGWSVQEVDAVPVDAHDRPLDAVLTERAVLARVS